MDKTKTGAVNRQSSRTFFDTAHARCLAIGVCALTLIPIFNGAIAQAAIYSGRVTVTGSGTALYRWTDTEGGSGCRVSGVDYVHWVVHHASSRYVPQVSQIPGLVGFYDPQIVLRNVPVTTYSKAAGTEGVAPNCGPMRAGKLAIHSVYPTMIIDLARPAAVIPLDVPVTSRFRHTFLDPLARNDLPGATGPRDDYFKATPMSGTPHFVARAGLVVTLRGKSGSFCEKLPIAGGSNYSCHKPVSDWHASQGFALTIKFH